MRRPLKVLAARHAADGVGERRAETSVSPIPESSTKRDSSEPSTVTGTVTRCVQVLERDRTDGDANTLTPP